MPTVEAGVAETRQTLIDIFIEMTLEVGFENLRLRSLAERAGVSQMTLYRYFSGKSEIAMHILREGMGGVREAVKEARSPREESVLKYRYLSTILPSCRFYLSLPAENPARQMVRDEFTAMMLERYELQESARIPIGLATNHLLVAGDELLAWYVDNVDSCSPEEVAAIYGDMIMRATADVSLKPREDWLQRFRRNG